MQRPGAGRSGGWPPGRDPGWLSPHACVGGGDPKSMEVTVPPGGWQPSRRLQLFPRWDRTTEAETKEPHMLFPGCRSRVGSGREGGGGFPVLQARDASDSGRGLRWRWGCSGCRLAESLSPRMCRQTPAPLLEPQGDVRLRGQPDKLRRSSPQRHRRGCAGCHPPAATRQPRSSYPRC